MTIYLDHAASSPLRDEVRAAWLDAQQAGNPSSVHASGQRARRLLEDARESLAETLDCEPIEIVFTSGGTESANLALRGVWGERRAGAVVLPDAEHHATIDTVAHLASLGARVAPVPVDAQARIDGGAFAEAVAADDVVVATALAANNESGTVNPVAELGASAARAGVPLHIDAVAALGHAPVRFRAWRADAAPGAGVSLVSVSGHKIGAPAATGALVVSRHIEPVPLIHGGGQQRGLRAGTQDVAGATAFALAARLAEAERASEHDRLVRLRERLLRILAERAPRIRMLGDPDESTAAHVQLLLPGAGGEEMLYLLDMAGISVSTGSACQAGVTSASHVGRAMGLSEAQSRQVLRLSPGRDTSDDDIDRAAAAVAEAYARLTAR